MTRRLATAPAVLAVVSLCACAGPGPLEPKAGLPARYDAPALGPTLSAAQLDHWWLVFNDPALNRLESEALASAPDARTAYERLVEIGAVKRQSIAKTLPSGGIGGTVSKEHEFGVGPAPNSLFPIGGDFITQTASLNVSWELDLFGRLALQRKIASATAAADRFNVEGALASLAANVASDYFQATGLQIQIEDAQDTVRIDKGLTQIAQEKADRGLGALSDADRVAGDEAQAEARVADLKAQLHTVRRQLLVLIGKGTDPVTEVPVSDKTDEAPAAPTAAPGELLERRPDVREAEARFRAQRFNARLAHLAIFPTFTLQPNAGITRTVTPSVGFIPPATLFPESLASTIGFWTLAGGISQPVLDIPRLMFAAHAEDARTREDLIAYEKTVQTAYGEAENALVSLDSAHRAVVVLTAGEAKARFAYDAAERRYSMGLDDLTSALTAQQSWRATRLALTTERVQSLERAVDAYKAMGGGWTYTATSPRRSS